MSMNYFNEKEVVKKRQPHKRKAEKITNKECAKSVYEKFIDSKVKQNLRPATLNKFVVTFKNLETFHATRTENTLYLEDINADYISDYVYWLKNDCVKFDGHKYTPKDKDINGGKVYSLENCEVISTEKNRKLAYEKQQCAITTIGENKILKFDSISEASRELNIPRNTIHLN